MTEHRSSALRAARWPQLAGAAPVVLQPLGSCEQHGPHLPLGTDTFVAETVAADAAERLRGSGIDAWCAPPLEFGASGEHQGFPGTVSIGHQALELVLVELGRSACTWAGRLVFVNGHGGNLPTVGAATARLRGEGRDAAWYPCATPEGSDQAAHAGRDETSLLLTLAPALVRPQHAEAGPAASLAELMPRLRRDGVAAVSPSGVLGDPVGATATLGRVLLDGLVDGLLAAMSDGAVDADGRLRPPGPGR